MEDIVAAGLVDNGFFDEVASEASYEPPVRGPVTAGSNRRTGVATGFSRFDTSELVCGLWNCTAI